MIWANLGYGIKLTRTILDQKKVLAVSEISGITLGFFFTHFSKITLREYIGFVEEGKYESCRHTNIVIICELVYGISHQCL